MPTILGLIAVGILACFGFVLIFGAPYLPTLGKPMKAALELAELTPGQHLLELGCGDGKILIAAAQRGVQATGFELNPLLVIICKIRTWRYRKLIAVHWANFWTREWPPTDVIFIFGLNRIMTRLDKKIAQEYTKPVKLVSFAFPIPDKKEAKKKDGVFLYRYS